MHLAILKKNAVAWAQQKAFRETLHRSKRFCLIFLVVSWLVPAGIKNILGSFRCKIPGTKMLSCVAQNSCFVFMGIRIQSKSIPSGGPTNIFYYKLGKCTRKFAMKIIFIVLLS